MSSGGAHDRIAAQPWHTIGLLCWLSAPPIDRFAPPLSVDGVQLRSVAFWLLFGLGATMMLASLRRPPRCGRGVRP